MSGWWIAYFSGFATGAFVTCAVIFIICNILEKRANEDRREQTWRGD